jgi:thiamine-monophosphate kinase
MNLPIAIRNRLPELPSLLNFTWILTAVEGERNPIVGEIADKLNASMSFLRLFPSSSPVFERMQLHPSGDPPLVYAWLTMKKDMGELALIERIRTRWGAAGRGNHGLARNVALGIGDDCAILRPPRGHEILVTTDFTLEGRHFRRDWHSPESVGHRTLARGLSDLAAMGARPLAAFLSLALPAEMLASRAGRVWVERFFTGMRILADQFNVPLAGGDSAESPCGLVLADIVLIGSAPAGRALRRSGGRAGDALYVTGELGGAAAELAAIQLRAEKKHPPHRIQAAMKGAHGSVVHPQMYPQPRIAAGMALLRRRLATAAIDLSDGLSTDLAHLCRESSVGAEVSAAALPIHPLAGLDQISPKHVLKLALHGGEDYELLFAAPPTARMPRTVAGVRITRIGSLVRGSSISLLGPSGDRSPLQLGGWEHFTNNN